MWYVSSGCPHPVKPLIYVLDEDCWTCTGYRWLSQMVLVKAVKKIKLHDLYTEENGPLQVAVFRVDKGFFHDVVVQCLTGATIREQSIR